MKDESNSLSLHHLCDTEGMPEVVERIVPKIKQVSTIFYISKIGNMKKREKYNMESFPVVLLDPQQEPLQSRRMDL